MQTIKTLIWENRIPQLDLVVEYTCFDFLTFPRFRNTANSNAIKNTTTVMILIFIFILLSPSRFHCFFRFQQIWDY